MSETVLARFAIGVNGFFSMFCQILGAFWWVPIMVLMEKEHSDTVLKEHSDSARNKVCVCVCVCVCKLDCKSFLNVFGLKNCKITIKKEKNSYFVGTNYRYLV